MKQSNQSPAGTPLSEQLRGALFALIDQGNDYHPTYLPQHNSDHLPMALCAGASIGILLSDLAAYQKKYSAQLHLTEPRQQLVAPKAENQISDYDGIRHYLRAELKHKGREQLLGQYLPALMPAMALEAFHPMIRLAYALQFEIEAELINALAYWLAVPQFHWPTNYKSCDLRAEIDKQAAAPMVLKSNRFGAGIREQLQGGSYPELMADSWATAAATALSLYRGTRNFFALHMVTGTQAARACANYLAEEDQGAALGAVTSALLAAHSVVGSPGIQEFMPPNPKGDREHNHKYLYSCMVESQQYSDPRYAEEIALFKTVCGI